MSAERINLSSQGPQQQSPLESSLQAVQEQHHLEIQKQQKELLQGQQQEIQRQAIQQQYEQERREHEEKEEELQRAGQELQTPSTKTTREKNQPLSSLQGVNRPAETRMVGGGVLGASEEEEQKQEPLSTPSQPGEGAYEYDESRIIQDDLAKMQLRSPRSQVQQQEFEEQQAGQQKQPMGLLPNEPATTKMSPLETQGNQTASRSYESQGYSSTQTQASTSSANLNIGQAGTAAADTERVISSDEEERNRAPGGGGTFQKVKQKFKDLGHDIKKSAVQTLDMAKSSTIGKTIHDSAHKAKEDTKQEMEQLRQEPYSTKTMQSMTSSSPASSTQQATYEGQSMTSVGPDACETCGQANCTSHLQTGGIQQAPSVQQMDIPPPNTQGPELSSSTEQQREQFVQQKADYPASGMTTQSQSEFKSDF